MTVRMKITDLARMLKSTPGTIERWIRQGRIPVRQNGEFCEYNRFALEKWADTHHMTISTTVPETPAAGEIRIDNLDSVMRRGGVIYDVSGNSTDEVLADALSRMDFISGEEQKNRVLKSLMDREDMMSTGIGKGVAIPHPRIPFTDMEVPATITTCFLRDPVDYKALDAQPVFVLFVLMAPSAKLHLHLLARLSFCLRNDDFVALLRRIPGEEDFYHYIDWFEQQMLSGK
jgi:nitrogen PTS system EIIA component